MSVKINKIEDLGYDDFFETSRKNLGLEDFPFARVIAQYKGAYKVKNIEGEYLSKITGKQIFQASSKEHFPTVGDWVAIKKIDNKKTVIQGILPRKTIIKRKYGDKNRAGEKDKTQLIASNIDVAFVVESTDRDFNLNRFERYFAIIGSGGVRPIIILNKVDLISKEELEDKLTQIRNRFGDIYIIPTSIVEKEGLNKLKRNITKGRTYCFLGSSGVGKSSLINCLLGEKKIKTGEIGSHSGRGKHVTTKREMYFLENGGIVIDNPGMREIGMAESNIGLDYFFDKITTLAVKCKFADCTHTREPGCAVTEALDSNELNKEKYQSFLDLKKEAEYYEMTELEKRKKDRQFGKFIKKAKKDLKYYKHKDYSD